MGWSHYDAVAENIVFAHFMLAWCLIALDLFRNLKRYKRRKEERKLWLTKSTENSARDI